jgi:phosphonate transport system substrate-binding protein
MSTVNLTINAETLTFGVVPQQSASRLAQLWSPISEYISDKTGENIRFATAPDIPTFEKRIAEGRYDIAYMNPYHFVVFNAKPGYHAIVHAREKTIRGIIVVRKDSTLSELTDLDGAQLAFPAPAAFAASILTRSKLSSLPIQFQPIYVSSHDSVYRAVAKGFFSAGGGVIRTYKNVDPSVREQLKILWTSDGFTPHAIATHPNMDHTLSNKIQRVFIAMDSDETGRKLLQAINLKGFEIAQDSNWDDVRSLKFDLLDDL